MRWERRTPVRHEYQPHWGAAFPGVGENISIV